MENDKKKILFVCNYFAPENTIAAVRTTKLVKYFRLEGFDVDVLTEKKDNMEVDEILEKDAIGVHIYYAQNSEKCRKLCAMYQRIIKPHKDKRMKNLDNRERVNRKTGNIEFYPFETAYPIIGSLDYVVGQIRQKDLSNNAQGILGKLGRYDLVITSYGDSFAYYVGKRYKQKNKSSKWIFDIRDAVYRYKFTPDYVKWIPLRYESYIWKNADAIVGVSKGICKRVPIMYRDKVHYIPNGYDDICDDLDVMRMSSKMCFSYTGSMYGGLQNVSAFFIVLRELINEKLIEYDDVEIHYAGNPSAYEIFKNQASKGKLENACIFHGKLSRKESIELQRQSDVLLMASNDYKRNNGGIITGKLLEYMAADRPVIAIVTGDIENSEVSQIIGKTNIGICYEESNKINDLPKLKKYIYEQYLNFKKNKKTTYLPVIDEKKKFMYSNLAKKYVRLINKLEGELQ